MTAADILGPLLTLTILAGILLGCWAMQAHADRMAADRRERERQRSARMRAAAKAWTRTER